MTFRFLEILEVLEIHQSRIELYGGSPGVRDLGLLQSALSQPQAGFGGEYLHKDVYEIAAAYLYHLARNHPFIDGNKRTALAAALVFLSFNGYEVFADQTELGDLVIAVSEGSVDKSEIALFLKTRAKATEY
ncbi:MAG: type II toxin-antitoxin system death-on-curing family toxin [Cyanobacteria bacterium SZAS LIN-5]|nr:type II toxin-antitoxin system death-on-curing family toxin [Cyanobacteria bacterium SZAS LIN-5]